MSADTFLYIISFGWLGAKLLTNIADILAGGVYTIRQTRRLRGIYTHPHSRHLRVRPLVSVVVYAHHAERTLEACLDSLRRGTYRNLEVIVVEYGSRDVTRQVARRYMVAHPRFALRLVARRARPASWQTLIGPRAARGEFILYLNGRQRVDRSTIHRAVAHLAAHNETMVWPAIEVDTSPSLLAVIQQYGSLSAAAACRLGLWDGQHNFMARAQYRTMSGPVSAHYADDIVIREAPPSSYSQHIRDRLHRGPVFSQSRKETVATRRYPLRYLHRLLVLGRQGVSVSEPAVILYFVYLALFAYSPQPLVLAWLLGVGSWLFYVAIDHRIATRRKIWLVLLTPGLQSVLSTLSFKGPLRTVTAASSYRSKYLKSA